MSTNDPVQNSFEESLAFASEISAGLAEPVLLLDGEFRIRHANSAFCAWAGIAAGNAEGQIVFELADRRWDVPRLRVLLGRIAAGHDPADGEAIPHDSEETGREGPRFRARKVRIPRDGGNLILLSFEDLDDRRQSVSPHDQSEAAHEFRERERKQAALLDLGDRLRDPETPGEMTSAAMELLVRTLGAVRAGYARFDADQDHLAVEGDWCRDGVASLLGRYRVSDYGSDGARLRRGETGVIDDAETDPLTRSEAARWRSLGIGAALHVPLVENGRLSALFFVHDNRPRVWTKEEITFARKVADRTWAAIERARSDLALKASEERFRLITNVAPQVVWTATPDGQLDFVSKQFTEQSGIPWDGTGFVEWSEAIHPDDLPNTIRQWVASLKTGEPYEVLHRIWDVTSGRHRWHLTRALPMRNEQGEITKWLGANTDIDDRKRAEHEREEILTTLVHERAKLAAIIEQSPAFICVLRGPEHDFDLTNERFLELVGRRELIGKTAREAIPEIQGQGFLELLDQVYQTGKTQSGDEVPVEIQRQADGPLERRFVNFVIQATGEDDGKLAGLFVHGFDVTDMVRAREAVTVARDEAEAANRMKDEFLATLSHELRTPLNAIVGWSRVLQTGKVSPRDMDEGLAAIQRNAQAQSQLIEDLLDISRIVSGNLKLEVRELNPGAVIEAALASVMHPAEVRGIRIETQLDPLAGPVRGDFARLQQVVWNLLSNAIKFSPKGGRIRVLLERVDSHTEIRVVDEGIGIEPEFLPHVFDRFRQADGTTTRRHGGLGLGLSIVKKLVELHGGEIHVKSPGREQGATFIVLLPTPAVRLSTDPSEPRRPGDVDAKETKEIEQAATLAGVRVLVLDDEPDARQLLHRILTGRGAEVALAASVDEAEAILDRFRPDVLVSDIGLPDRDGYEFIRLVRSRYSSKELPAAALTAFARSEDRKRALLAGFQTHVAKPVDPDELAAVVASLAGKTVTE